MQFQNAVAPLDQPHKLRETRREIARLLTELNNRRHEAQLKAAMNQQEIEN